MTAQCPRCRRPTPDGYVCHDDAQELADALLTAAGHAEDANSLDERGARLNGAGSGNGETPLPDLTRSARYTRATNTISTWTSIAIYETGRRPRWRPATGPLCPPIGTRCDHGSCDTIRRRTPPDPIALSAAWLARQIGWLRKHPTADNAFRELHGACQDLARLVDRPPAKDLVGMCDCGRVLYAHPDQPFVTCPRPTCKLRWNVTESRDILRRALDGKLVTAAEAARLGQYLDTDRTQEQIRKLINAWSSRGRIVAHGQIWREPTEAEIRAANAAGVELGDAVAEPAYRFGDVADRLARTPRRQGAAA